MTRKILVLNLLPNCFNLQSLKFLFQCIKSLLLAVIKFFLNSRYKLNQGSCTYLGMFLTSLLKPTFVPSSSPKPAVSFEWINGENNTLQFWDSYASEPTGGANLKCSTMCNGFWQDDTCSQSRLFICETQYIGTDSLFEKQYVGIIASLSTSKHHVDTASQVHLNNM